MIQGSAQNRNRWYKDQPKIETNDTRISTKWKQMIKESAQNSWTPEQTDNGETTTILYQILNQCSHILQRNTNINAMSVKESVKNKFAKLGDAIASNLKLSITHLLTERGNKLNILEVLNTKSISCSSRADCCGRPGPTRLRKILQAREHHSAEVNNILQYFGMLWHV